MEEGKKPRLFSLQWFSQTAEKAVETTISKRLDKLIEQQDEEALLEETNIPSVQPYRNVKLINDVLVVVLNTGDIISKTGATSNDFQSVTHCITEEEIMSIMSSPEVVAERKEQEKEVKKMEALIKGISVLKELDDFNVREDSVYLKGIERSMPQLLVERFIEMAAIGGTTQETLNSNTEYLSLKRFWMWCCLNARPEVTDRLYDFLSQNGMKITKEGMFVALRNVVTVEGSNPEIISFITNVYQKVKAVWKKNAASYYIWQSDSGEYSFDKKDESTGDGISKFIGNLQELYLNLPTMSENRYTDQWTKTFDIRVGQPVCMAPEDCNWSTQDCATAGLHFAGHTAPYVLCGNTTVFTLINPMKVVGIGTEKGRCYEYLPFMTTTVEEANEIMNSGSFDFLELDEQYAIDELENLETNVKNGFAAEIKKYSFNIPAFSKKQFDFIVKSLGEMKKDLEKRVVNI